MAYTPQHVANFFLKKAAEEQIPITQLKLIKLVYIAYGWVLAVLDKKLFNEGIEAWQHGPVIPSVYHEFKDFGNRPINKMAMEIDLDNWETRTPEIPSNDTQTTKVLEIVWKVYKKLGGWTLREMTHADGTPWEKVYTPKERGILIGDEDIKSHYQVKIREYVESAKSRA